MLGPVQFVAFEFDTLDKFEGGIIEKLDELTSVAAVRILDILFVAKEQNGDLIALESGELGEEDGDEFLGTVIGALMGFSFEGEDQVGAQEGLGDASAIGVTPDDIRRIGRELAPDSAAALLLIEHRWAAGLRDEILAVETIELAREIEAAVVAGTVLGPAEAGIIDKGDLADAMDAVLEADRQQNQAARGSS